MSAAASAGTAEPSAPSEPHQPIKPSAAGAPRARPQPGLREDAGALAVRALADELARVREENARLAGELARVSELAGQWHGYAAALERRACPKPGLGALPPPPPKHDGLWARLMGRLGRADESQKGEPR